MITWDQFTRAVIFALGVVILLWAATGTPTKWGLIVIALVMLGVITGEQFRALWQEREAAKDAATHAIDRSAHLTQDDDPPTPP